MKNGGDTRHIERGLGPKNISEDGKWGHKIAQKTGSETAKNRPAKGFPREQICFDDRGWVGHCGPISEENRVCTGSQIFNRANYLKKNLY